MQTFLRRLPLHTLLFSLYPVLALWLSNFDEIPFFAVSRPLIIAVILFAVIYIPMRLIVRKTLKAAILSSLLVLSFSLYGHVFGLLDNRYLGNLLFGRHRFLLPIWLVGTLAAGLFLFRVKQSMRSTHRLLNTISIILAIFVSAQILYRQVTLPRPLSAQPRPTPSPVEPAPQTGRDVYYIVLDTYGREDYLADAVSLDNADFINELQEIGFIVDPCAQANYDSTRFSLASSLNMDYLDALLLPDPLVNRQAYLDQLVPYLKYSRLRHEFEKMGYQFFTFKAVYPWIDIQDSDFYFDAEQTNALIDRQEALNFQFLYLNTTLLRPLLEGLEANPKLFNFLPSNFLLLVDQDSKIIRSREYRQYVQNEFAFDELEKISSLPGRKFVYAHLFPNHQPFVYDSNGSFRSTPSETLDEYRDSIIYTNRRMLGIVKTIIEQSDQPPVIIIQGDHNAATTPERVKILNALYLPEGGAASAYHGMTPVNTFRLVLDFYFGQTNGLLPDRSFHVPQDDVVEFTEVSESCADRR